ncbi:hypothetical protein ABW20_dc0100422 [Dactylellina cionopaga]|nr:hypothetical protein ABW20_dc0100422 [Dactylellina cionopaga]
MLQDLMHLPDAWDVVRRVVSNPKKPQECTHASKLAKTEAHPELLPRSTAKPFIHDEAAGKRGYAYEQLIGPQVVCRLRDTEHLVKNQPEYGHILIETNYHARAKKGYGDWQVDQKEPVTMLGKFTANYGCVDTCHHLCYGNNETFTFSHCRFVESGGVAWLVDIGPLDAETCGHCDTDILAFAFATSVDTSDRIRDTMSKERFNVNCATGRQNKASVAVWKGFVTEKPEGFCCPRTGAFWRVVKNLFVWLMCNPVYYTYKCAYDEGLMGFVEALNNFFMPVVRDSQLGGADPAKVDQLISQIVGTRLPDFLVLTSA